MNRDRPRDSTLSDPKDSGISTKGASEESVAVRDIATRDTGQGSAPVAFPPPSPSFETVEAMARMSGLLAPGSTFGVYVVGECIGEGGMARIYRAEHSGLRRQVALKVLINGFAKDVEGRERFVREARIAAAIKHPNVVNIFDVGVHDNIPYLVMELLEGTDLESLVQSKGALDENLIVDIMVPVVAGLSAVHDAGIVHRDLKPGNIFLSRGRYEEIEPKLLDFGISKGVGQDPLKLTTNGLLIGTPFYMPPEGLRGEEMTPLSDQYSLGVVMYECATGQGPFSAATFPELTKLIAEGKVTPPDTYRPELSKRLVRIILRAMSVDPAKRYKDLREMGRDLLQLAGQRTRITWGLSFGEQANAIVKHEGPRDTVDSPGVESSARRRKAALALAVLAPLAVGVGVLGWPSRKEQPPEPSPGEIVTSTATTSPEMTAHVGPQLSTPPPLEPSKAEKEKTVEVSQKRVAPPPQSQPSKTRVVPKIQAAAPASEPEPEWAIPRTQSSPPAEPSGPPTGANGAPIFD